MPFEIVHGDITKIQADAIVNAANSDLQRGGGVCGAIFAAAGARDLQIECNQIGHCETGQAVITKAYNLPAKYIVHTVGPVWGGGDSNEETLLYNCYMNALRLAKKHGCTSIAFPLISSGIYGYPKEQARAVAENAILDFLEYQQMQVKLVLFQR
jgi:O-acetyl-ADP-ribose deacetylase (regulator of RNase III)